MAYTTADLTQVETAIKALATGERVTSARFSDGKSVTYQEADLDKLMKLRTLIAAELAATSGRKRSRLVTTDKGY